MLDELYFFGQITSPLEIIAMVTGIIGVWLTVKENIWCFPIGILNVSLYAWLFFTPGIRLYADAFLQCIYFVLLIYGWIKWNENKNTENIYPVTIKKKNAITILLISIAGTFVLGFFLSVYTNASYPWLDSALTCASLAAQWMIAKKIIENWLVWIVADIIYLPLYVFKHLPLTAILYGIFLWLAFKGYLKWKKNIKLNESY